MIAAVVEFVVGLGLTLGVFFGSCFLLEYVRDLQREHRRQRRDQVLAEHLHRRRRDVESAERQIEADLIRFQAELTQDIEIYRRQEQRRDRGWS